MYRWRKRLNTGLLLVLFAAPSISISVIQTVLEVKQKQNQKLESRLVVKKVVDLRFEQDSIQRHQNFQEPACGKGFLTT